MDTLVITLLKVLLNWPLLYRPQSVPNSVSQSGSLPLSSKSVSCLQLVSNLVSYSVSQSFSQLINQSLSQPIRYPVAQLVSCSISQYLGTVSCSFNQSVSQLYYQSCHQPVSQLQVDKGARYYHVFLSCIVIKLYNNIIKGRNPERDLFQSVATQETQGHKRDTWNNPVYST